MSTTEFAQSAWSFIVDNKEILAVFITFGLTGFTALLGQIFSAKPNVKWAVMENSHLLPRDNDGRPFSVFTQKLWFRNVGRKVAENVEIVLNFKPQHFEVFPHLEWDTRENPDGRLIIKIERLNPRELLFVSMLNSNVDLPSVTNVRWNGGQGKQIEVWVTQKFPHWINLSALLLMLLGGATMVYVIVRLALG